MTSDSSSAESSRAQHVVVLNWRDPWHPEGGGSELYVQQVSQRLVARGHRVTTLTARYPGSARTETVDGIRFVRRGGHLTVYLWAALLLLTRRFGRVDRVLEIQNGVPFLARLFTRAPVVVLVHHVHREQWPVVGPVLARVGWFLESRVAPFVNRSGSYVAVSQVTATELQELGVDPQRISIAHNGLPPAPPFAPQPRTTHPSVVVLSRLVPHKQVEHAIEAVGTLATRHPDLRLTIMGSGWWEERLFALVAERHLEERVTFLGHVSDRRKFEELSRSWLHVLPSLKEGWGLSIMEAARVGVPSVAYASAGGVQESILDGVTGILAADRDDLATCIDRLLGDEVLREELGAKAALRSDQFTWATTAAVIEQALLRA